jgi:O-antigen/teichoic acid export membrane protein
MSPVLADLEARGEPDLARTRTTLYARALAASMLALTGVLVLASDVWMRLFYGAGFGAASRVLPVLLAGVLVQALAAPATARLLVGHSHGQRIFAASNVGGLLVGLLSTTVFLRLDQSITSVAWGYFCGAAVVSMVPIGIVWRGDRHRWLPLAVKIVAGVAVVAGLRFAEISRDHRSGWDLAVAIAFSAAWLALCRDDLQGLKTPRAAA